MPQFEILECSNRAVIKVLGVGGGGNNAVEHMLTSQLEGVEFICANTDAQVLKDSEVPTTLQFGDEVTDGLGAGADPQVGRQAAVEDRERIRTVVRGSDMVFITAGMGGGTGTGAAPVMAEIAKEEGILVVAVVTKPFREEGKARARVAENGIEELKKYVDSLITIPNDKLISVLGEDGDLEDAFGAANNVLLNAVKGISEIINCRGLINVDFADVRTVMSEMGMAMMGTGVASGEDRATKAAQAAVHSPLMEDINLNGARGVLVNVTAASLTLKEFREVGTTVQEFASEYANVVLGTVIDDSIDDEIRVTVVATGLETERLGNDTASNSSVASVKPEQTTRSVPTNNQPAIIQGGVDSKSEQGVLDIPAFLRRQAD
ncbi:MAG: cell division protein FtsZ [Pseudomonadota bacterium]|nr:cell division protein FtsZ [Pseudomonadota bacterium]